MNKFLYIAIGIGIISICISGVKKIFKLIFTVAMIALMIAIIKNPAIIDNFLVYLQDLVRDFRV